MPKYRKKPVVVEAVQWFPSVTVPGVDVARPKIHYSLDGNYYYVSWHGFISSEWLESNPTPGDVPDEIKKESLSGAFQFRKTGGDRVGETYFRRYLPFAFFDVKERRETVEADVSSDLFLDYASASRWNPEQQGKATVTTIQGQRVAISPGEWVITESDGVHHYPCSAEEFSRLYEPADDHDNPKAQG